MRMLASREIVARPAWIPVNGDKMSVLVYIVLTVAVFALLGLVQKLVERL
jgi:hypothetical protein